VSGSRDKRKERCQEDGEAETAYCVKQRRDDLPACARFGFGEFSRRAGDFAMAMALACAACQP